MNESWKVLEEKFGKTYRKGEILFKEGEMGTHVFFILSGKIRISTTYDQESGAVHELATLSEGDIFGELAVLDDLPRSATATALEESRIIVLNREQFYANITRYPSLAVRLLKLLGSHIRRLDDKLKRALSLIARS